MVLRRFLIGLILLLFPGLGMAAEAPVLVLSPNMGKASWAGHMEMLADPAGSLTIGQATERPDFTPMPGILARGFTHGATWLRIRLESEPGAAHDWWLEMLPAFLDRVTVYFPDQDHPGQFIERATGDQLPLSSRDWLHHHFVLKVPPLADGRTMTVYVRVQTGSSTIMGVRMYTTARMAEDTAANLFALGLVYGDVILMLLLSAIFGIWLRKRIFLAYAGYALTSNSQMFVADGLPARFFWPDNPIFTDRLVGCVSALSVVMGCLFVIELLELKRHMPRMRRAFQTAAALAAVACLFSAAGRWDLVAKPFNQMALAGLLASTLCAARLAWQRVPSARFFLLAFSAHVTATSIAIIMLLGVVMDIETIAWPLRIAALMHVVMIGAGLANRLRLEQKNSKAAVAAALAFEHQARSLLETRVEERTADLQVEIDQRRQAMEQLEMGERRSRTFLATVPLPLMISRISDGLIVYSNQAFRTLFDIADADEGFVRTQELYAGEQDRERVLASIGADKVAFIPEVQGRSRTGRLVWVSISCARVEQDGQECIFAALMDISVIKEHEATLRRARDSAEAADQAKSAFLAMMSHEIRTPMTGIISVAGLLMETPLTAAQRDWVRIITGSGESLLTILNDILDFSKLEQDKLELETAPFQLPKLLSDTVELMRNHAEAKDLNLRLTLEPSLEAWVEGDANRLRQILLNLIGNAVKFTDRGHVAVAARCLPQPAGYTLAEIEVEDTGIGMSEDTQARLFTPFTQADASISRRYGGTGLGLAISRRLAVAMGGGITVSSREAHGSRFTLALPLPKTVAPFCAPSLPGSGGLPPLHLLLVEDHRINAMVVQAILDKFGHSIELAVNGLEAIHAISSRPPGHFQAVLMDMQMPEMDGLEATRAIRRMKGPRSAVPIIAMTANAFSSDVEHCMQAGMNGYLSKPVDPAALFAELRRVLEMETA